MDSMKKYIKSITDKIYEQREEIITAFIAKYGCGPEEIVQECKHDKTGGFTWRIRSATEEEKANLTND